MPRDELGAFLGDVRALAAGAGAHVALAAVAEALAARLGADLDPVSLPVLARVDGTVGPLDPPRRWRRPEVLGVAHEALLAHDERRRRGAYYTPEALAALLVGDAVRTPTDRVCDPAVGGGAFVLAAARRLVALGARPAEAVAAVEGGDIDPVAVDVARTALALFGWDGRRFPRGIADRVRVADALADPAAFPTSPYDAVVTNPPFLGQLATATARTPRSRRAVELRFGPVARGYADTAVVFLALGLELARPGGRIGIVLPRAVLASRDAGAVRRLAAARADVERLWWSETRVFAVGQAVCAAVLRVREPHRTADRVRVRVRRSVGIPPVAVAPLGVTSDALAREPTWSWLTVTAADVPDPGPLRTTGTVGDVARATAGFRDEFYGLAVALVDDPDGDDACPPAVTCGLLDPGRCLWGVRRARIAGRDHGHPRVDLRRVTDARVRRWAAGQLVPKVLVATQTRTVEAVVDAAGSLVPFTPVVAVHAPPERLWHLAATLTSPVVTAIAARTYAGAALAVDAIKLSATQVRSLPTPPPGRDLDRAAAAMRAAHGAGRDGDADAWRAALVAAAGASCAAFGVRDRDALVAWWAARLPPWRAPTPDPAHP